LEVLLDDGYWPAFSTTRARSARAQWDHVGEGFIKELDFGRVWLRLNENDEGEKDDIISEYKCEARRFLEQTLVSLFLVFVIVCEILTFVCRSMALQLSRSPTKTGRSPQR
jgi:Ca2+-dependent lipid-binding protein